MPIFIINLYTALINSLDALFTLNPKLSIIVCNQTHTLSPRRIFLYGLHEHTAVNLSLAENQKRFVSRQYQANWYWWLYTHFHNKIQACPARLLICATHIDVMSWLYVHYALQSNFSATIRLQGLQGRSLLYMYQQVTIIYTESLF